MKKNLFLLLGLLLFPACESHHVADSDVLKVTAVQFSVREEIYLDPAVFEAHIDGIFRKIMSEFSPDLIVFPEYTGAFLAVSEYDRVFTSVDTLGRGLQMIEAADPEIDTLHELFLEEAESVAAELDHIFGTLARKYGVYVVGGSYFHKTSDKEGNPRLVNRLVVYNPRGSRCYRQDKVFLTPFESEFLELSPGKLPEDPGIVIEGVPVVFTICRDSFFEEWEEVNRNGYLWIDIKGNGEVFDDETKAVFRRALPSRLKNGDVPYGITVSLTGQFLELFWEGRSFFHRSVGNEVFQIASTDSWTDQEFLHIKVPEP